VDVEFRRAALSADGVVIDIGRAGEKLNGLLRELDFKNLDDDPAFAGKNTTTEFLAGVIHERMAAALRAGDLGADGRHVDALRVVLHESHLAWAAYEAPLGAQ
jgi:6-pyruvoyl-tetrahydropterin synthase